MVTPNRTAALGASAAAVVAVLVSLLGAVDTDRKAAVFIAALAVVGLVACVFLVGGQRWEELVFRRDNDTPDVKVTTTNETARPAGAESPAFHAALELHDPDDGYLVEDTPEDAVLPLEADPHE